MEHKLAVFLEQKIGDSKNRTELDKAKMTYGLEVLLNNLLKLLVILLLAVAMGVCLETIFVFVGFGILRLYAGGVHCDTNKMCWFSSILICVGNAYLAKLIAFPIPVALGIVVVCIFVVARYAPSGTKKNPIKECEREIRKRKSLLVVLIYAIVIILGWQIVFVRALAFGMLSEAIALLPIVNLKYREK